MAELTWLHWVLIIFLALILGALALGVSAQRFVSRCIGILIVHTDFMTPCEIVMTYRLNFRSIMPHEIQQTFLTDIALPNLEKDGELVGEDNLKYPCHCVRMYKASGKLMRRAQEEERQDSSYVSIPGPMPA